MEQTTIIGQQTTKDDYAKALEAYQTYLGEEIKAGSPHGTYSGQQIGFSSEKWESKLKWANLQKIQIDLYFLSVCPFKLGLPILEWPLFLRPLSTIRAQRGHRHR